jgi:hypothetical protein
VDNSLSELVAMDPALCRALLDLTNLEDMMSEELGGLSQLTLDSCNIKDVFEEDMFTCLVDLVSSWPPGSAWRPFTAEEQQALEDGHIRLQMLMGQMQGYLSSLSRLLGARAAQLQQDSTALAATLKDHSRLLYEITYTTDASQKTLRKLGHASAHLKVSSGSMLGGRSCLLRRYKADHYICSGRYSAMYDSWSAST